ncbi:hypothetical protein [Deinococcus humi]|uniref:Putative phage gp36 major capsid-like protein n=1 Tax=Deinococcus humi TaxID=662880 RepID=A0A7W8JVI7_9DEIO|nr:hypothetical protein [Deinococcus humi]MBB5364017.1 putative phage gp36 major capsid-like protein [Deinococcus humi]GGO32650.1 hypothetical protein GCM10008949_30520 [Deinococcus humi]
MPDLTARLEILYRFREAREASKEEKATLREAQDTLQAQAERIAALEELLDEGGQPRRRNQSGLLSEQRERETIPVPELAWDEA